MKTKALLSILLAAVMVAAIFPTGCIMDETPESDVLPTLTPDTIVTDTPENTLSAAPETPVDDGALFDVYTAQSLIPVLAACLESVILAYPGSDVFPVTPITDDAVYTLLYTYAQANYYIEGVGAALSTYEITEFLRLVYGDAYTYEDFERAVRENHYDVTPLDEAWDFGMGETYAPIVSYASGEDLPLDANTPYIYEYEAAFDEQESGSIAVYVVPDNSSFGVRIVKIERVPGDMA